MVVCVDLQNTNLQVLVHHPSEYPFVREKGLLLGNGVEIQVQVDASGRGKHLHINFITFLL